MLVIQGHIAPCSFWSNLTLNVYGLLKDYPEGACVRPLSITTKTPWGERPIPKLLQDAIDIKHTGNADNVIVIAPLSDKRLPTQPNSILITHGWEYIPPQDLLDIALNYDSVRMLDAGLIKRLENEGKVEKGVISYWDYPVTSCVFPNIPMRMDGPTVFAVWAEGKENALNLEYSYDSFQAAFQYNVQKDVELWIKCLPGEERFKDTRVRYFTEELRGHKLAKWIGYTTALVQGQDRLATTISRAFKNVGRPYIGPGSKKYPVTSLVQWYQQNNPSRGVKGMPHIGMMAEQMQRIHLDRKEAEQI